MELKIHDLSKHYGDVSALTHVSAHFTKGLYGLLGPNGSGKSTFMNILTLNRTASSGQILWNGTDIRRERERYVSLLGYAPQQQYLYPAFTGLRFMYYMAALKGLRKKEAKEQTEYLLRRVNLHGDARRRIGHYSGGMKQRLLVAQALLGSPEVILLDEPSAGLDPRERVHLRNLIAETSRERIVIVATHIVSDIESIADDILFLKKGVLRSVHWQKEHSLEELYLREFGKDGSAGDAPEEGR